MSVPPSSPAAAGGLVRLLNTAGGRVLCLAGDVDDRSVDSFLRRYGREPMPVDAVDAGSVTRLSVPGLDLVLDHLDAAERAGRPVRIRRSPEVAALLPAARRGGAVPDACPAHRLGTGGHDH